MARMMEKAYRGGAAQNRGRLNGSTRRFALRALTALVLATAVSATCFAAPAAANPFVDAWNGIVSFFSGDAGVNAAAAGDETTVADPSTLNNWEKLLPASGVTTRDIGRIWADKTVDDDDITLQPINKTINKGEDADFLVGLSALSSMSKITTEATTPLDIVLVLDDSGSMNESFGGGFAEISGNQVSSNSSDYYYVRIDGSYYRVIWNTQYRSWVTTGVPSGDTWVKPRGGQGQYGEEYQFYLPENTRMDSLKEAVGGFIRATDEANQEINDATMKHQISLVQFSTSANTKVLQSLTSNAQTLQNSVNAMTPTGGTRADLGMQKAEEALRDTRTGAKKVVIFFTDGEPGPDDSSNAWSNKTANAAMDSALALKNAGATVFSVGVFNGANPTDLSSRFNAYMNGVSSNYPKATGCFTGTDDKSGSFDVARLGTRAPESEQYYMAATNSDELNKIFEQIAATIQTEISKSPIAAEGGAGNEEGYITFRDELGEYTEVEDFKSIVYADTVFSDKTKTEVDENTVKYTFKGEVAGNEIFKTGNMEDIEITVTKGQGSKGDTVTVRIPASLIPLRNYVVTEDADGNVAFDVTKAYPIRVFYGVKVKDAALDAVKNGTDDPTLAAWIKAHTTTDKNGKKVVDFHSNYFDGSNTGEVSGETDGNTTAVFTPAKTNGYYYVEQDTPLYLDPDCKTPLTDASWNAAGGEANVKTLYYQQTYYTQTGTNKGEVSKDATVAFSIYERNFGNTIQEGKDGQYYIVAGSPRLARIDELHAGKENNETETAVCAADVWWTDNNTNNTVFLGNNGKLSVELPAALKVSKSITADEGLDKSKLSGVDFEFKIHINGMEGKKAQVAVIKTGADESTAKKTDITFDANGDYKGKIKADETLIVYGLNQGAAYTVTEINLPDGFKEVADKTEGATGTIAADPTAEAKFTNNYSVTSTTFAGVQAKKAYKVIDPDTKQESDIANWGGAKFKFQLAPVAGSTTGGSKDVFGNPIAANAVPMPDNKIGGNKEINISSPDAVDFSTISYTKPGTYVYHLSEVTPDQASPEWIGGVTYSSAIYHIEVAVTDNGKGGLSVTPTAWLERTDNGTALSDKTPVTGPLTIKNTYQQDADTAVFLATKNWDDKTGGRELEDDQFAFVIEPVKGTAKGGAAIEAKDMPKPESWEIGNAADGSIAFNSIEFQNWMEGYTFEYRIYEKQPTESGKHDDTNNPLEGAQLIAGKWVYQGVTYDNEYYTATVTVSIEDVVSDGQTVKQTVAKTTYKDSSGNPVKKSDGADADRVPFTNSYDVKPVTVDQLIQGKKTMVGRDMKNGETYSFTLEGTNQPAKDLLADTNSGLETTAEVQGGANGVAVAFDFGNVTFTKAGTYTFNISENAPNADAAGVTYDRHTATVTIVVNDSDPNDSNISHTGQLRVANITYDNSKAVTDASNAEITGYAAFTNVYRASGSYTGIEVTKELTGRTMAAGEFEFTITAKADVDNTDAAQAKLNAIDANKINSAFTNTGASPNVMKKLQGLSFTQDDAGKTFVYVVDEVEKSEGDSNYQGGIIYDTRKFEVAITVNDNADGSLELNTAITEVAGETSKATNAITFKNEYTTTPGEFDFAGISLIKVLSGRDWTDKDSFTFNIEKVSYEDSKDQAALDGMPLPNPASVTLSGKGGTTSGTQVPFNFIGKVQFTKAGTYVYKVTEEKGGTKDGGITYSSNIATITVEVTDDGQGHLSAQASTASPVFTNEYNASQSLDDAVNFELAKTLNGHAMAEKQFSFKVTALPGTDNNAAVTAGKIGLPDGVTFGVVSNLKSADDGERFVMAKGNKQMTFTREDSGKTFVVEFREEQPTKIPGGYTYDNAVYTMEATPTDQGNGTMSIATKVTKTWTDAEGVEQTEVTEHTWNPGEDKDAVSIDFVN